MTEALPLLSTSGSATSVAVASQGRPVQARATSADGSENFADVMQREKASQPFASAPQDNDITFGATNAWQGTGTTLTTVATQATSHVDPPLGQSTGTTTETATTASTSSLIEAVLQRTTATTTTSSTTAAPATGSASLGATGATGTTPPSPGSQQTPAEPAGQDAEAALPAPASEAPVRLPEGSVTAHTPTHRVTTTADSTVGIVSMRQTANSGTAIADDSTPSATDAVETPPPPQVDAGKAARSSQEDEDLAPVQGNDAVQDADSMAEAAPAGNTVNPATTTQPVGDAARRNTSVRTSAAANSVRSAQRKSETASSRTSDTPEASLKDASAAVQTAQPLPQAATITVQQATPVAQTAYDTLASNTAAPVSVTAPDGDAALSAVPSSTTTKTSSVDGSRVAGNGRVRQALSAPPQAAFDRSLAAAQSAVPDTVAPLETSAQRKTPQQGSTGMAAPPIPVVAAATDTPAIAPTPAAALPQGGDQTTPVQGMRAPIRDGKLQQASGDADAMQDADTLTTVAEASTGKSSTRAASPLGSAIASTAASLTAPVATMGQHGATFHTSQTATTTGTSTLSAGAAAGPSAAAETAGDSNGSTSRPTALEVGFHDTALGWLSVRASVDRTGDLHAALASHNPAAASAVSGMLPALGRFLQQENVAIQSVSSSAPMAAGVGLDATAQAGGTASSSLGQGSAQGQFQTGTQGGASGQQQRQQESSRDTPVSPWKEQASVEPATRSTQGVAALNFSSPARTSTVSVRI